MSFIIIFLIIMVHQTPVPAESQQWHHDMHPAYDVNLEVRDNAAEQVLTIRLGPINLPAHSHHLFLPDLFMTIPFDGWFTAFHPRIVDDAGTHLPGTLLHHTAWFNTAGRDFICPQGEEFVYATGGEMRDWPELPGMGLRVAKGDRIRTWTMFHNQTATWFRGIYFEVRVQYKKLDVGRSLLKNVYASGFYIGACPARRDLRGVVYDLKPGGNVTSGQVKIPFGVRLIWGTGHLHDYGRQLYLENVTRQEVIAIIEPGLDREGRVRSMPAFSFIERDGYRLESGDILKLTATYDNQTSQSLPQAAMAIFLGYFLPDRDEDFLTLRAGKR